MSHRYRHKLADATAIAIATAMKHEQTPAMNRPHDKRHMTAGTAISSIKPQADEIPIKPFGELTFRFSVIPHAHHLYAPAAGPAIRRAAVTAIPGRSRYRGRITGPQLERTDRHLVARTIADLAGSADILGPHVAEAIGYRRGERAAAARVA